MCVILYFEIHSIWVITIYFFLFCISINVLQLCSGVQLSGLGTVCSFWSLLLRFIMCVNQWWVSSGVNCFCYQENIPPCSNDKRVFQLWDAAGAAHAPFPLELALSSHVCLDQCCPAGLRWPLCWLLVLRSLSSSLTLSALQICAVLGSRMLARLLPLHSLLWGWLPLPRQYTFVELNL